MFKIKTLGESVHNAFFCGAHSPAGCGALVVFTAEMEHAVHDVEYELA